MTGPAEPAEGAEQGEDAATSLSVASLAAAYRRGGLRPSTAVRAHLDRIARLDPRLGAYQAVYADDAMQAAEAADRLFAAGDELGPFQGIPFVLKDICDVAGQVTTGGSVVMTERVAAATGTLAARLIAAGGILLGKTKTVESALGGWGTNQHMGTPWNPWDRDTQRVPGGSSSGTGVAVAAGMASCGVGTDTGGSVRLPAAYCGLVGLKVTEGRLPTDGIQPLSHTLDTPGPLARSVEDALVMFLAMDGAAGAAAMRDLAQRRGAFAALDQGVDGLRLGVLDARERAACDADVLADYDTALDRLRQLGAELTPLSAPKPLADLTATSGLLIMAEGYFHQRQLYDRTDLPLDTDVRARMLRGREVAAFEYLQMQAERRADTAAFQALLGSVDAFLTPTTLETAPAVASVDQDTAPSQLTRFVNWFGLCALSLPAGISPAGLPTSLQVVAPPGDEAMALRIGAAFEAARGPFAAPPLD